MNANSTFTWFKLPTALITQPKFQRLTPIAQAGFMTLCCVYWQDSGTMTYDDANMNAEGVDELIERGYIQEENGMISIGFLDEQIEEVDQLRTKKKEAGVKSAEARAKRKSNTSSTPVEQPLNNRSTDKSRGNKIDESKKIEERELNAHGREVADAPAPDDGVLEFDSDGNPINQPPEQSKEKVAPKRKVFKKPTFEEVQEYFDMKYMSKEAEAFWNYYESNGWRVGRNPMKDWKASVANWIKRAKEFNLKPTHNGAKKSPHDITEQEFAESLRKSREEYFNRPR